SPVGTIAVICDQKQGLVQTSGRATVASGLLFDLKDEVHGGLGNIGVSRIIGTSHAGFELCPLAMEGLQRRAGGIQVFSFLLSTILKALAGAGEGGQNALATFLVGEPAAEGIIPKNEVRGLKHLAGGVIVHTMFPGLLEITLSRTEVAEEKSRLASAAHGIGIFVIELEDGAVLAEGIVVVVCAQQTLGNVGVGRGGGGKTGRRRDEFGLGLGILVVSEQEVHQFQTGLAAARARRVVPYSVNRVVVVAKSFVELVVMGGKAGEFKIDLAILRGAVPEIQKIGAGLVVMVLAESGERFSEIELVSEVIPIEGEGGAEMIGGKFEIAIPAVREAAVIHVGGDGALAGIKSTHQAADNDEAQYGSEREDQQHGRGFLNEAVGARPIHIGRSSLRAARLTSSAATKSSRAQPTLLKIVIWSGVVRAGRLRLRSSCRSETMCSRAMAPSPIGTSISPASARAAL